MNYPNPHKIEDAFIEEIVMNDLSREYRYVPENKSPLSFDAKQMPLYNIPAWPDFNSSLEEIQSRGRRWRQGETPRKVLIFDVNDDYNNLWGQDIPKLEPLHNTAARVNKEFNSYKDYRNFIAESSELNKFSQLQFQLPSPQTLTFTFTPKIKLHRFKITVTNIAKTPMLFKLLSGTKQRGIEVKHGWQQIRDVINDKLKNGFMFENVSINSKTHYNKIAAINIKFISENNNRIHHYPMAANMRNDFYAETPVPFNAQHYIDKVGNIEITIPPGTFSLTFNRL